MAVMWSCLRKSFFFFFKYLYFLQIALQKSCYRQHEAATTTIVLFFLNVLCQARAGRANALCTDSSASIEYIKWQCTSCEMRCDPCEALVQRLLFGRDEGTRQ